MTKEKRFCPKCKSEDVTKEIDVMLALGAPQNWKCNKCGYYNVVFPIKENIKEKNKNA